MVIEEDELIRNENGQIVGYEGEYKAVWAYMGLGLVLGILIGAILISPLPAPVQGGDPHLRDAGRFCEEHSYDSGYYTSGLSAPLELISNTTAGVHCYNSTGSHLNDTWRTTAEADFYVNQHYEIVAKTGGENPGG